MGRPSNAEIICSLTTLKKSAINHGMHSAAKKIGVRLENYKKKVKKKNGSR